MKDNDKQIQEWQNKVRHNFESAGQLEKFLYETMDNFYYRYLETAENKNLHTEQLAKNLWGAQSFESNMVDALKNPNPNIKPHVMDLAKRVPKAQKPMVRYRLAASHEGLSPDKGKLTLISEVSWDFPDFADSSKAFQKKVIFAYADIAVFRKELALKLEEACTIFIG